MGSPGAVTGEHGGETNYRRKPPGRELLESHRASVTGDLPITRIGQREL
jgi:hypothetical protein